MVFMPCIDPAVRIARLRKVFRGSGAPNSLQDLEQSHFLDAGEHLGNAFADHILPLCFAVEQSGLVDVQKHKILPVINGLVDGCTRMHVLEQNPKQVPALNNLAWVLGTQKTDHRQAFELLETAITVAGPTAYLLDTRGFVALEAGRLDAAIDDFTIAAQMNELPATQYHLALALFRNGDDAAAREHLEQALAAGLQPHMLEGPEVPVFKELQSQLGLTAVAARE